MKFSSLLAKTSCALALFFGCSAAWAQQPGYRMVYNNDGTDMLGNYWFNNRPLTVADLDSCVSLVAATGATTYQMCSGSDLMTYESSFARFIGDDVNGTLRCGDNTAAFNANNLFYRNYVHLKKEGADMIRHSLQKAKEKGMETMVTYRMNDLHFADTTSRCPIHYPEFWLQHPQYWVGDTLQGYHSFYALDFSHPEVRQHRMNLIKEQLLKYADVMDGYELDFMRFFVYFPTYKGQYHCEEMTELVRQVRHLADSVGALHHKRLLLSARVAPRCTSTAKRDWTYESGCRKGCSTSSASARTGAATPRWRPARCATRFPPTCAYRFMPLLTTAATSRANFGATDSSGAWRPTSITRRPTASICLMPILATGTMPGSS